MGDRFAHQGKAQLQACALATKLANLFERHLKPLLLGN
jgi:hypothetical protein